MSRRAFVLVQDHYIYINSTIYNDTNQDIPADYSTTFSDPIIKDMGEYEFCIIRFQIPNTIPIFKFLSNTYYITLSFNGNDFQFPLIYTRHDNTTQDQVINNFQHMVDIINTTFTTAFNALKTAFPLAPPTEAPFMVFDYNTDAFTLYVQQLYDSSTNTIEIYFNTALYQFFYDTFKVETFSTNSIGKKDIRFIVSDERNNVPVSPANYYIMRQMSPTLYQWYDVQSIYFTSNIDITHEYVAGKNTDGRTIQEPIVTDFIPDFSRNDRSQFIYNADPYRWIDCRGHGDVYNFDYRVNYLDKQGKPNLFYIPPNNSISAKFCFKKKEIENKYLI